MPNIAQQDYIIIDWEGKDSDDATKKAEVDAILKNSYLANPLSLFSIIFKNYGAENTFEPVASMSEADNVVYLWIPSGEDGSVYNYQFSIA